jgi:hypothetical protein
MNETQNSDRAQAVVKCVRGLPQQLCWRLCTYVRFARIRLGTPVVLRGSSTLGALALGGVDRREEEQKQ